MALSEEGGMVMPVGPINSTFGGGIPYPVMGGYSGNNGFDGGWWIILLFILLASGNWGGMNNDGMQRGFDQAAAMNGINGVQSGITGISTQLCNGFANAETSANARQMANMNQAFAAQAAMSQGFNQLGTQFADCCCENRLATADLKYTIATENCADRYEASQNTRDIIDNANRNNQAVIDKLCALELDGYKRENDNLRQQLTMANLAASQNAQTSRILADNAAQTIALEQYLNPTPVPAYVVQNPNCCSQNGCCCGSF